MPSLLVLLFSVFVGVNAESCAPGQFFADYELVCGADTNTQRYPPYTAPMMQEQNVDLDHSLTWCTLDDDVDMDEKIECVGVLHNKKLRETTYYYLSPNDEKYIWTPNQWQLHCAELQGGITNEQNFWIRKRGPKICAECVAGKFAATDASSCTDCDAGTYSKSGSSTCTVCDAGTYSETGAHTCSSCKFTDDNALYILYDLDINDVVTKSFLPAPNFYTRNEKYIFDIGFDMCAEHCNLTRFVYVNPYHPDIKTSYKNCIAFVPYGPICYALREEDSTIDYRTGLDPDIPEPDPLKNGLNNSWTIRKRYRTYESQSYPDGPHPNPVYPVSNLWSDDRDDLSFCWRDTGPIILSWHAYWKIQNDKGTAFTYEKKCASKMLEVDRQYSNGVSFLQALYKCIKNYQYSDELHTLCSYANYFEVIPNRFDDAFYTKLTERIGQIQTFFSLRSSTTHSGVCDVCVSNASHVNNRCECDKQFYEVLHETNGGSFCAMCPNNTEKTVTGRLECYSNASWLDSTNRSCADYVQLYIWEQVNLFGYEDSMKQCCFPVLNNLRWQNSQCMQCPSNSKIEAEICVCDAGYYRQDTACLQCPEGKFKFTAGNDISSCVCPGGQFSPTLSATHCLSCVNGTYSVPASTVCSFCDAGYSSELQSTTCRVCDVGYYSASGGLCTECAEGKFSSNNASTFCNDCYPGHFSGVGAFECIACLPGTYTNQNGSKNCSFCPPGKFEASTGSTECMRCEAGQMSDVVGAVSAEVCKDCGANTYCDDNQIFYCPEGTMSLPRSTQLIDCYCKVGFGKRKHNFECDVCDENFYSAQISIHNQFYKGFSGVCKQCPANTTSMKGSVSENDCECPAGSFKSELTNNECLRCGAGTFKLGITANTTTSSTPVITTTYEPTTSSSTTPQPSSTSSTTTPPPPPPITCGQYEFVNSNGVCEGCGTGEILIGTTCQDCPAGQTSNDANSCVDCAAGKYERSGRCRNCLLNQVSDPGSTSCLTCFGDCLPNSAKTDCVCSWH